MFFYSWQLWEKMTFVLSAALLAVVIFGWVKLASRVRLIKKREIEDEEKRCRIKELRAAGQRGDSRGKHEIPFGVRAIQSGIQVDGIWISNSNTPVPSEVTLSSVPGESSDDLAKTKLKPIARLVMPPPRLSLRVRPSGRSEKLQEIYEGKATRPSYKPRRSSQLRYGGQQDYTEETIDELQTVLPLRKKLSTSRSPTCLTNDRHTDLSVADNERNSGTSDGSDVRLSLESQILNHQKILSNMGPIPDDTIEKTSSNAHPPYLQKVYIKNIQESNMNNGPPIDETLESIYSSYILQAQQQHDKDHLSRLEPKAPSRNQAASPFTPGELHMNKVTRKVNPGFEVLPAGTFGAPIEFNTDAMDLKTNGDSIEKRHAGKLQKRLPDSSLELDFTVKVGS